MRTMFVAMCALVSLFLLISAGAATAAPPPPGFSDPPPDDGEVNDTYSQRTILAGSDGCKWTGRFSGRLGDYDARFPRTRLCYTQFAGEFCTAEQTSDVNPTVYTDYGLFFLTSSGPFQIRVTGISNTGYGQGVDHGQFGGVEIYVRFFDASGFFISETVFTGDLTGNNTLEFFNVTQPAGTFDFDIIVNALGDERGDVDYYQVDGLRPNAPYRVTIDHGYNDRALPTRPLDTTIVGLNSIGVQIPGTFNDDIGASGGFWNRRSATTLNADAFGRIRFAISGWNDTDFDGFDNSTGRPHRETGGYGFRVSHVCPVGCSDVNGDCIVNSFDLAELLGDWGMTCP